MRIDVDALTDAEVSEIQDHMWDASKYEGKTDIMSVAMKELSENMLAMPLSAYRNYLRNCEDTWEQYLG